MGKFFFQGFRFTRVFDPLRRGKGGGEGGKGMVVVVVVAVASALA
jgi:hypothetical protein